MHNTQLTYGDDDYEAHWDEELERRMNEARRYVDDLWWRQLEIDSLWQDYEKGVLELPATPADSQALWEGILIGLAIAHAHPPPKGRIDGEWDYGVPGLGNLVFKVAHPRKAARKEARVSAANAGAPDGTPGQTRRRMEVPRGRE